MPLRKNICYIPFMSYISSHFCGIILHHSDVVVSHALCSSFSCCSVQQGPPCLPLPSAAHRAVVIGLLLSVGNVLACLIQLGGKWERYARSSYNSLCRLGTNVQWKPQDKMLQCSYKNEAARVKTTQLKQEIKRGAKKTTFSFWTLNSKILTTWHIIPTVLLAAVIYCSM